MIMILLGRMGVCALDLTCVEEANCVSNAGERKPVDCLTCSKVTERLILLPLFKSGIDAGFLVYFFTAAVQTVQKWLTGQDVGVTLPSGIWKS